VPDDVKFMATSVLAHRLILKAESILRGTTASSIIGELLHQVDVGVEGDL
jgi:MoxR-like ATPase